MHTEKNKALLIVDDVPANIQVLANALEKDYQIQIATNGEQALKIASSEPAPDLILLDIIMPGLSGYDVCKQLKSNTQTNNIPIIFVTALDDAHDEEIGLNLGAVDYITKPYHLPIVKARIRNHLALKLKNDLLEEMSQLDGLTHIANRRFFDETLDKESRRATRIPQPISIIMIDIDYFKLFNDNYGHGRGDECLIKIAQTMKSNIKRSADLLARYGGEEFVVLLPETDLQGGIAVAETLRQAVDQLQFKHEYSSVTDHVTISLGVACNENHPEMDGKAILLKADQALYQAKAAGRNQVKAFHAESIENQTSN